VAQTNRDNRGFNPVHWKIGTKIWTVMLLAVMVSVASLTLFNYFNLSNNAIETKGKELVVYGHEAVQRSADIIKGSVGALQTLALSPSIIEGIATADQSYAGREPSAIQNEIIQIDSAWANGDASASALVTQISGNALSAQLRRFQTAFPEEAEVFITDRYGAVVAMTARTGDYLQADEDWWKNAYHDGQGALFVSEVDYDDSSESWAIDVGVPIYDLTGQSVIGVLRGTVDISVVFEALEAIHFGETGYAALLDREGKLLYAHDSTLLMQPAPVELTSAIQNGTSEGWRKDLHDLDKNPAVIAYRTLEGPLAESLGWTIVLEQDRNEVDEAIQQTLSWSLLVALGTAIALSLAGVWVARTIARPLVLTTQQAQRLALGDIGESADHDAQALLQRGAETGDLLRAFRALREYVQEMVNHARKLAGGDLAIQVLPKSDHDALSQAFQQMLVYQQTMGQAADRLAHGDVAVNVQPQSQQDRLGNAFAQMVNYQQTMAEAARKLAQGNVSANIQPQTEQDVLGRAFAQMIAYQQRVSAAASRLAQGDLSVSVTPQTAEDALGHAFAQMIANLRELVGQMQRHAAEVAMAAQQINAVSEQSAMATGQVAMAMQQIARGAAQQTDRMNQTNDMVQQVAHAIEGVARGAQEQSLAVTQASDVTVRISNSIEQVVRDARTGAEESAHTAQTAQAGARIIEDTIEGMQTIKKTQDEARSKVTEMGARAEEIGMIVVAIEKIADQTNLLALNAAIEAARAGEHGKGFAVVADEVRRLAENAGNATQEIVALVKGIQRSVAEAVQAMEAGAAEMNAGVVRSQEAGRALGEILGAVNLVNRQMTDIAHNAQQMSQAADEMVNAVETVSAVVEENTAATEEMASGSEEVLGSIEEVAGITEENGASVEEVSASVEEVSAQAEEVTASAETLREMAQELNTLVARFRLEK